MMLSVMYLLTQPTLVMMMLMKTLPTLLVLVAHSWSHPTMTVYLSPVTLLSLRVHILMSAVMCDSLADFHIIVIDLCQLWILNNLKNHHLKTECTQITKVIIFQLLMMFLQYSYSEGFNEFISEFVEYDEYKLKFFYGRIEISACREYSKLLFQL